MRRQVRGSQRGAGSEKADADLIAEMHLPDSDALGALFRRYIRLVHRVAVDILRYEGEAEDVTQEVFLEIYRKSHLYDPSRGAVRVWLLQYAYTRSINRHYHLQHRHFYSKLDLEEIMPSALSTERAGDRWLTSTEAARYLAQAFAQLNSKQRRAIELISIEGMTFVEAAEKAGESLPATRHNYYRGMVKLRDILLPQTKPEEQGIRVSATAPIRLEVANL